MNLSCEFCNGGFRNSAGLIEHLMLIERRRSKARIKEVNLAIEQLKSGKTPLPRKDSAKKVLNIDYSVPTIMGNVDASENKPERPRSPNPVGSSRSSNPVGSSRSSNPVGSSRPSNPGGSSRPSNPNSFGFSHSEQPVQELDFSLPEEFPEHGIPPDPTHEKVRLIVPEDWLPYLEWKHGGRAESYRFVSSCLYRKIEGDMALIEKIYLEGRPPEYYPIRVLNHKTMEFCFRGADQKWNKSTRNLYKFLRGNIQDAYIRYQNQGIADQMKRNSGNGDYDNVLSGHDYGYWQAHISDSYTSQAYQKNFLKALAELLEDNIAEYQEKHGSMCRGEPRTKDMYLPKVFINHFK